MTDDLIPGIRNAVRAVIFRNRSVLLQHKRDDTGRDYFTLPGGAQEPGECLADALLRECEEEIGARVKINDLVCVGDFFKQRKTSPPTTRQLLEFLFACDIDQAYEPRNGQHPDKHQVEIVWMPLDRLDEIELVPSDYAEVLRQNTGRVYLGSIT